MCICICRHIHLAIDEACTHVGVQNFRLVAGVFEQAKGQLLGTACSLPIRVVSNNDAPGGAAHITLAASIRCLPHQLGYNSSQHCFRLAHATMAVILSSKGAAASDDVSLRVVIISGTTCTRPSGFRAVLYFSLAMSHLWE